MGDGKVLNNILYEDNHIIVVVKDPNIPVQADDSNDMDMLTMIKDYLKKKYQKPGNVYVGLVQRLDRPVGGVMVFAKTSKAASRLSDQIRKNEIQKTYLALVHGKMDKQTATLENYLLKDEQTHSSSVVDVNTGKKAVLDYDVIKYDMKRDLSLLEIKLHTGRHHQIRVQLSYIHHPIYGDQRYGQDKAGIQIHLRASKLTFNHPTKNEMLTFESIPSWAKLYSNGSEN
jgi:23S rRNA pseudouridine1911/1915/1917 synthase